MACRAPGCLQLQETRLLSQLRRPARRPPGGSGLSPFRFQVGEDLLDDIGVLNARDDSHRPAAGRAGLDVDTEHPFQALRTAQGVESRCPLSAKDCAQNENS